MEWVLRRGCGLRLAAAAAAAAVVAVAVVEVAAAVAMSNHSLTFGSLQKMLRKLLRNTKVFLELIQEEIFLMVKVKRQSRLTKKKEKKEKDNKN